MNTEKLQKQNNILCEQMNTLSNSLLGYREGTFEDILIRAKELVIKAENVEIDNQFSEIANKITELNELCSDIKTEA